MSEQNSAWKSLHETVSTHVTARKTDFYILCVDDEPDLLEILQETIPASGFKCVSKSSAKEALAWLEENGWRTALIISDFNMPEMDGFAFCREVPAVYSIPFVILSAFVDREMALKGVDFKIAAFVSKPASDEQLADVIAKHALSRLTSLSDDLELHQGFIEDAKGLLEQIEPLILGFEESPSDKEALNSLYGMVHTIKGASGFFEPKTMHNFVHKYEDRLKQLQSSGQPVSAASVGMMLKATDTIRKLLTEMEAHSFVTKDIAPLLACLEISDEPAAQAEEAEVAAPTKERAAKIDELRVEVALLDRFIQASGEMTVVRNMITKSVQAIEKSHKSDRDVQMLIELLEEFHKINASVQGQISDLRKVPLRTVIKSLPRIVRDLSKGLGKSVTFSSEGDDVRVDTAVINALSKSLVHIVRNSLDHGLEPTSQRGEKNPAGKIEIRSLIKDDFVIVEVSDDGRGINTPKIIEKAVSQNLFTREQLAAMAPEDVHLLIFESGFSTADQVTDVSGRGVGMSVVKESVEELGGHIQIDTKAGVGTTIRLVIPVPKSVLIKNCLFVAAGREEYGIPHDQIVRVVHGPKIEEVLGRQVFRMGPNLIPVVSLSRLFTGALAKNPETFVIVKTNQGTSYALPIDEVHDFEDTVVKPLEGFVRSTRVFSGATFLGDGSIGLVLDVEGIAQTAQVEHEEALEKPKAKKEVEAQAEESAEYLLFELGDKQPFAIPAGNLHRIEEMNFAEAIHKAPWRKVPYRNGILNVIAVEAAVSGREESTALKLTSPVLVVEVDNQKFGLEISAVREFFRTADEVLAPPCQEFGVIGNLVYQGRTITVVDPDVLIRAQLAGRKLAG